MVKPSSPEKRKYGRTVSTTTLVDVPSTKMRFLSLPFPRVPSSLSEVSIAHLLEAALRVIAELHLINPLIVDVESIAPSDALDGVGAEDGAQAEDVGLQAAQSLGRRRSPDALGDCLARHHLTRVASQHYQQSTLLGRWRVDLLPITQNDLRPRTRIEIGIIVLRTWGDIFPLTTVDRMHTDYERSTRHMRKQQESNTSFAGQGNVTVG